MLHVPLLLPAADYTGSGSNMRRSGSTAAKGMWAKSQQPAPAEVISLSTNEDAMKGKRSPIANSILTRQDAMEPRYWWQCRVTAAPTSLHLGCWRRFDEEGGIFAFSFYLSLSLAAIKSFHTTHMDTRLRCCSSGRWETSVRCCSNFTSSSHCDVFLW